MLATIVASCLLGQAIQVPGRSDRSLSLNAYMPGQREMVLGIKGPYTTTTMEVVFLKDAPADFSGGGVSPGAIDEIVLGNAQWSVTRDNFDGKKCLILTCSGSLQDKITPGLKVSIVDFSAYWVDEKGKILRQFNKRVRPFSSGTANSVFREDRIDVSVEDERGRRTTTVFPKFPMSALDDQFKPMIVDGKVVVEQKEFQVFDPFKFGFDKYSVRLSGTASGVYFGMKFEGKAFEIVGPNVTENAAISKEGDLIKVDLPRNRFMLMRSIPNGKGGGRG